MAKKFETSIECSSKKFQVCQVKPPPVPFGSNRRGFVDPRYRKSINKVAWVQHKERHEIPTGTLNKLKMKPQRNSKKIPNLEKLRKSDKYLLAHQTVDSDCGVTVSYHKGNIIPTAGGGVAVSLYEEERVTQKGTLDRNYCKRDSGEDYNIIESKRFKD